MFLGFVTLEDTLQGLLMTRNGSNVPTDANSTPAYRVYGPDGLMNNGSGSASLKDSGSVTGATNASPIVITSVNHGITTGARVKLASVGGNTAANGTFIATRVDANTFSLDGSTGNGSYTTGGTWHVVGLYSVSFAVAASNGFESGQVYSILTSYVVSSTSYAQLDTFQVQ